MNISFRTGDFRVASIQGKEVTEGVWDQAGGAIQQAIANAILGALGNIGDIGVSADELEVTFSAQRQTVTVNVVEETYSAQ